MFTKNRFVIQIAGFPLGKNVFFWSIVEKRRVD